MRIPEDLVERARQGVEGKLPPPWVVFPDFPPGAVAWRMGGGEDYLTLFWGWLVALERQPRQRYVETLVPAPAGWDASLLDWWLHPIDADSEATEEQLEEACVALGLG
ncbi:MAG: hypothetical protein AB8H86_18470 [Polyangiales bacterium]